MSALIASPLLPVSKYTDRRYLRRAEGVLVVAAAIATDWSPICAVQVPTGDVGFIVAWFAEVNDPSWDPGNSSISFRVARNASPYIDFASVNQPMGDRTRPEDTMLQVQPGDSLTVSARRTATGGAAQQVIAGFRCLLWPLNSSCDLPVLGR